METEDLKRIVAKNITDLRKKCGMTQLELADALNYTDKAISKWERGESIPDVIILKRIADLFAVTVDYLLAEDHPLEQFRPSVSTPRRFRTRCFVTGMAILLVWLLATFGFVILGTVAPNLEGLWLAFIVAIPISLIVWLILNSIWFNPRLNYLIISLLMWSFLATLHLSLLPVGNFWMLYLLGVPGQFMILFWSGIGRKRGL